MIVRVHYKVFLSDESSVKDHRFLLGGAVGAARSGGSSCFHAGTSIDWSPLAANKGCADSEKRFEIKRGMCLDRFGGVGGSYFSACGSTYTERSIPYIEADPSCESEYEAIYNNHEDPRNNYHQYLVLKPFPLWVCKAAPFCGHQGGTEQYRIDSIPGYPGDAPTVESLLMRGFLQEKDPTTYSAPLFADPNVVMKGGPKSCYT